MTRPSLLTLEELDGRMLPSVPAPFPQGIFPSLTLISNQSHSLHGTGTGNYIGHSLIVDAGLFDTLSGTAHLTGLGSFEIAGWLQGVGLVAHGRATGRLELVWSERLTHVEIARAGRAVFQYSPTQVRLCSVPRYWGI